MCVQGKKRTALIGSCPGTYTEEFNPLKLPLLCIYLFHHTIKFKCHDIKLVIKPVKSFDKGLLNKTETKICTPIMK